MTRTTASAATTATTARIIHRWRGAKAWRRRTSSACPGGRIIMAGESTGRGAHPDMGGGLHSAPAVLEGALPAGRPKTGGAVIARSGRARVRAATAPVGAAAHVKQRARVAVGVAAVGDRGGVARQRVHRRDERRAQARATHLGPAVQALRDALFDEDV